MRERQPSVSRDGQALPPRQLNLIPLGTDKKPLGTWKASQGTMTTDVELTTWMTTGAWDDRCNAFAVVTGFISDIVVVYSDSKDAEDWCQTNLPPTPWMVNTAKGG